jgi:hypothetical protein
MSPKRMHKHIVVTGSIAFDYLMSFPGKFTDHFLPEHMQRVSLSFLVDSMDKRRGGCAPNIAYRSRYREKPSDGLGRAGLRDYREWPSRPAWTLARRPGGGQVRRSSAAPTSRTTRSRPSTPAR